MSEELIIPLPNGNTLRCHKNGDEVRICTSADIELICWQSDEWAQDPKSIMRAIFGYVEIFGKQRKKEAKVTDTTGGPTKLQKTLEAMIKQVAGEEGCSEQNALRDVLTDLWHVAEHLDLDIELAFDGAQEVFNEEVELEKEIEEENTSKAVLHQPKSEDEPAIVIAQTAEHKRRNAVIQFAISYLMANLNDAIETSNVPLRPTLNELDLIYHEFTEKPIKIVMEPVQ